MRSLRNIGRSNAVANDDDGEEQSSPEYAQRQESAKEAVYQKMVDDFLFELENKCVNIQDRNVLLVLMNEYSCQFVEVLQMAGFIPNPLPQIALDKLNIFQEMLLTASATALKQFSERQILKPGVM